MSDEHLITNHSGRTGQRNGIALGEGQIRRIFPVFVLAMWVTAGVWVAQGLWGSSATLLAVEALVVCLVVFVNFVLVFSVGYAVCALLLNLTVLVVVGTPSAPSWSGECWRCTACGCWCSRCRGCATRGSPGAGRAQRPRTAHCPCPSRCCCGCSPRRCSPSRR